MFKKTIAVGPLEPAPFWMTGATGVARCLSCCLTCRGNQTDLVGRELGTEPDALVRLLGSCEGEYRSAIEADFGMYEKIDSHRRGPQRFLSSRIFRLQAPSWSLLD